MPTSSTLKHSLLAACLFSVCLAGCKDKKAAPAEGTPAATNKVETKTKTGGDVAPKADAPAAAGSALAYLPAGCTIAMHADLKSLAANPVIKANVMPALREALAAGAKNEKDFAAFMEATGLDPFADFHEFSLCSGDIFSIGGGTPKGFMTVTGDIDKGIIDALLKNSDDLDKSKVVDIKGQKSIDDDGAIFTQMTDGSLSGGNLKALVEAAIDKPNAFAADFEALGNADMRIVIPATTVTKGLGMPGSPFAQFAEKIDGATTVGLDVGNTTLTVKIATVDETSATELAGMAKLMLGQVPKGGEGPEGAMMAAVAAAKTAGEGKHFVMTMQLPAEQFEMASKLIAEAIRSEIASKD